MKILAVLLIVFIGLLSIILNGAGVWLCSYALNSIFQIKQLTFSESCLIGCVLSFIGGFFRNNTKD